MEIIVNLNDVESLTKGLNKLNRWNRLDDPIDYQCGTIVNGEFLPFEKAPWCEEDSDGRSAFFDAAARHQSLHLAIKKYLSWCSRYTYEESGAGIFAALALVVHFPEEVDTAIEHIARLDLNHEVLEGYHIENVVKYLDYNETALKLIAARCTICSGQHGLEDLPNYLENIDFQNDTVKREKFTDWVAMYEIRNVNSKNKKEIEYKALNTWLEDIWGQEGYFYTSSIREIGEEIINKTLKVFEEIKFSK